jgi:hypothetical protein
MAAHSLTTRAASFVGLALAASVIVSSPLSLGGALPGFGVAGQQQPLPSEPARGFGASVTGAFEGWFQNADGSFSFLVGYLNRNRARAVDVPIGPNNRIEPGGPDMGQPTHFLPGRHVGMFVVTVPKSFTPQQRLTWTVVVNGVSNSIPLRLHIDYSVSPFKIQHDVGGQGNTPPVLRFDAAGPFQGPLAMVSRPAFTRTTSVSTPLSLSFSTEDDARYSSGSNAPLGDKAPPPVEIAWSKYRGPGDVTFEKAEPPLEIVAGGKMNEPFRGKGATTAKFSEPGEYLLHVMVNDYSGDGGGGEVCCWTTSLVQVIVTP